MGRKITSRLVFKNTVAGDLKPIQCLRRRVWKRSFQNLEPGCTAKWAIQAVKGWFPYPWDGVVRFGAGFEALRFPSHGNPLLHD